MARQEPCDRVPTDLPPTQADARRIPDRLCQRQKRNCGGRADDMIQQRQQQQRSAEARRSRNRRRKECTEK